ncbi:MAG TPA: hypothetical protein VN329_12245 [Roseomonas sp.]|nr:hypothetical protein [Roseomonas sp.]
MTDESGMARLRRRMLVLRVAGVGALAAVLPGCVVQAPQPVRQYRGTGLTDADPNDGPGNGRGGRRGTGLTDADPNDGPGYGRGGRRGTGLTDADPNDGPGNGRGGRRRTGLTDSDPNDGPGAGRRGF